MLRDVIRVLSVDIGPRPSGGEGERRASEFVADRLKHTGFSVTVESFPGLRSFSVTYGLIYLLFVIAAALLFLNAVAAFAVSVLGFAAMIFENGGSEPVSRFLPKRPSRNVVGVKKPKGEVKQRVVLTCHQDSAKAALVWHPKVVAGFQAMFWAMVGAMMVLVVLTGWQAFYPPLPPVAFLLVALCAGYLLFCTLLLVHRQFCMPYVAGANDNASGVACVLSAVEEMGTLEQTELWVVATGCEESGLVGMARFCDAHPFDPEATFFINVDHCGAGRVAFTTREGMLWRLSCGERLVAAARGAVEAEPKLEVQERRFHTMLTDAFIPLRRGYPALSIMAFDSRGVLPHWHWPSDTIENIDWKTLEGAMELLRRTIRRMDSPVSA